MRMTAAKGTMLATCAAAVSLAAAARGAIYAKDYFKPDVPYVDGAETFAGPARGYAAGGWTTFKPEGLPNWHGAAGFHSSLWELSRFSGGREQGGKRPPPERVGGADIPLTDAMKADVRRYLEETRQKGGTLIVRLGYTWSDRSGCEPADFGIVLGHVKELSQIMAGYDDVVVGVEAGVAGPWAEMHSSDYCRPEYMNRVLKTYCDNLSPDISILTRTAYYIAAFAGTKSDGLLGMLPFQDKDLKRFGMYNDGYLGTWWDYGTWAGEWTREKGCRLLKTFGGHPYGGELAYVSREWLDGNRERCGDLFDAEKWNIVRDWYETHLSYLRNIGDRKHSLCAFIAGKTFDSAKFRFDGMPHLQEYDGLDLHKFMYDHMGYRFVVRDARLPKRIAGGRKTLAAFEIENTGFGKLLLPSRVDVLLRVNGQMVVCETEQPQKGLSALDGGAKVRLPVYFVAPPTAAFGSSADCELCLQASCPTKGEDRARPPARMIRFANAGLWDEAAKVHSFGRVEVR